MSTDKLGKRSTWGVLVTSDRPRDVLNITEAVEAKVSQAIAFASSNQSGEEVLIPRLVWNDSSAPADFAVFADLPVGTVIETPLIASIFGYQKIAKSADNATDWNKIAKAAV